MPSLREDRGEGINFLGCLKTLPEDAGAEGGGAAGADDATRRGRAGGRNVVGNDFGRLYVDVLRHKRVLAKEADVGDGFAAGLHPHALGFAKSERELELL